MLSRDPHSLGCIVLATSTNDVYPGKGDDVAPRLPTDLLDPFLPLGLLGPWKNYVSCGVLCCLLLLID